ncbi:HEAT repeats domain-containing protein [Hirsutella rhossiliensis]|uniref:HEAT repeats domain-containing protein n=1 Tax=Hirsutella rhossiliensis TaxID=111463 RepID=A0A9P8ML62_9HYPO|nr:HEAT repeats domain-containing protein [Hirsutella rhossiliensis]KAH0958318.1 HEAT repeats domain-containing protein [Hirsutella rhossiliensis]
MNDHTRQDRPILFIASCLGGVILMKALVMANNEYRCVRTATRGIVFLATPFGGTSFQDVAKWAEPGLRAWASLRGREVSKLLDSVKKSVDIDELVRSFTQLYRDQLCRDPTRPQVMTFYELGKTNLYHKVFPCLPIGAKPLVDKSSATLQMVPHPLPLDRGHRLMNKFCGDRGDFQDHDYECVAGKIEEFLRNIRKKEADDWIRDKHYTPERLKIERLSGDLLPMEQCYINLAIKVETPDETFQVDLATIFNQRKGHDAAGYNFEDLFYHEYFSGEGHDDGRRLARELWRTLKDDDSGRTLFILDGLDEVSQDIGGDNDMSRFLAQLLYQPNVVITSRPNANLPSLRDIDLDLETVGFYPDQVKAYLDADPKIKPRANEVRSFLQEHWLIEGLVRIPIQLDALCYTWDDFGLGTVPDTMTGIYRAIEQRLWRKDAVRLGKRHNGELVTPSQIGFSDVEDLVEHEACLLEGLAFTGLHNDVIDFTPQHQAAISKQFKHRSLLLDKTLPRLSFLRTSDHFSEDSNRNYHFLHLTFQEYFAARYFMRHWSSAQPLKCLDLCGKGTKQIPPVEFLRKQKYSARYDVFWRFVAGLIAVQDEADPGEEGEALGFFQTIEEEPLDLLGPTHQRLVMHCLSEVSTKMPLRQCLEEKLRQWLLFECTYQQEVHLTSEMEFPEEALRDALREGLNGAKIKILQSLQGRPAIPPSVIELAASWVIGGMPPLLRAEALVVLRASRTDLTNNVLMAVVQRLGDEDAGVRWAALRVLEGQSSLSNEILAAAIQRLCDEDAGVRYAALRVLEGQSSLSNEILAAAAQRLGDEDADVRYAALRVLEGQSSLSDEILAAAAQRLGDEDADVRRAALRVLEGQSSLSDEILAAAAQRLGDEDADVRRAALRVLEGQSSLSDEILAAAAQRLGDEDAGVRWAARRVLEGQSSLSDEILAAAAQRLGDEDADVRYAALRVLEGQSSLSDEILAAAAQRLGDEDAGVRWAALRVLEGQSSLSDEILAAAAQRLGDEDAGVRRAALWVLEGQSSLSDEILAAAAQRLGDEDADVRRAAQRVLEGQSSLSDEILAAAAQRLGDEDADVRYAALRVLEGQSSLSDEILAAAAQRLGDEDADVRYAALRVLEGQSSLSDEILAAAAQRLGDEDADVRRAAQRVLEGQSSLSDEILAAAVQRLGDEDADVRRAALWVLEGQSSLSDEILAAAVQRLGDEDAGVRRAALRDY